MKIRRVGGEGFADYEKAVCKTCIHAKQQLSHKLNIGDIDFTCENNHLQHLRILFNRLH